MTRLPLQSLPWLLAALHGLCAPLALAQAVPAAPDVPKQLAATPPPARPECYPLLTYVRRDYAGLNIRRREVPLACAQARAVPHAEVSAIDATWRRQHTGTAPSGPSVEH